jgi:hypothetical protein
MEEASYGQVHARLTGYSGVIAAIDAVAGDVLAASGNDELNAAGYVHIAGALALETRHIMALAALHRVPGVVEDNLKAQLDELIDAVEHAGQALLGKLGQEES